MNNIQKLTTAELETLSRDTALNHNLSALQRSAIQRGIDAELAARQAEVKALRAENSANLLDFDLL